MENKIKVVELFAGVGGFRLGLEGWNGKSASSGKYLISINKVDCYIQDKFDFEGFQPLGFWSPATNKLSKVDLNKQYYYVTNGSYMDY
jgi:hypothetical protein